MVVVGDRIRRRQVLLGFSLVNVVFLLLILKFHLVVAMFEPAFLYFFFFICQLPSLMDFYYFGSIFIKFNESWKIEVNLTLSAYYP